MLTTLTNMLLFFSGIALVSYGLYWGALVAFGSFTTGLLVEIHYFRVMANEITVKASDIKGSPARNPTEFAWEQVAKLVADVSLLKEEMAVLKDRVAQTQATNQHHYWIVSMVIAGVSALVAVLAFLGLRL